MTRFEYWLWNGLIQVVYFMCLQCFYWYRSYHFEMWRHTYRAESTYYAIAGQSIIYAVLFYIILEAGRYFVRRNKN